MVHSYTHIHTTTETQKCLLRDYLTVFIQRNFCQYRLTSVNMVFTYTNGAKNILKGNDKMDP
jgi:hypothetical protein